MWLICVIDAHTPPNSDNHGIYGGPGCQLTLLMVTDHAVCQGGVWQPNIGDGQHSEWQTPGITCFKRAYKSPLTVCHGRVHLLLLTFVLAILAEKNPFICMWY